jgi:hypothetical protein
MEYEDLPPKGEKLADVVVLAQAWKKSHTFIRRHNWYADVLELDVSTVDLEGRLVQWASEVMRLVVEAPSFEELCDGCLQISNAAEGGDYEKAGAVGTPQNGALPGVPSEPR